MKTSLSIALAASLLAATATQAAIPFTVSLESEAPGTQNSTAGFKAVGVETFESTGTGQNIDFSTTFGGSAFSGMYKNVQVNNADQYGGAGGIGQYSVNFSYDGSYSVDLSTSLPGGVTYFGFWLSALDGGNNVSFYSGGNKLFTFTAQDAKNFINGLGNSSAYYGNPTSNFHGQNHSEPYAFLNFYARGAATFDKVVFSQTGGGGYESDNHTVGQWDKISGTVIPISGLINTVPEPATWMTLITGFCFVGVASRRRKSTTARSFA